MEADETHDDFRDDAPSYVDLTCPSCGRVWSSKLDPLALTYDEPECEACGELGEEE